MAGFIVSLTSLIMAHSIGYMTGTLTSRFISKSDIDKANEFLRKFGLIGIIISRGIPVLAESVSIISGQYRIPFRKFSIYNVLGLIPVCIIYSYFGSLARDGKMFLISFGISIGFAAVVWLLSLGKIQKLVGLR